MRTHSVEKRHVCEDCGKAFKRKESLEVHQLTHTKRTGMGLTCDVCQESCRNRADYVTHIKQHIEAGEKMGPDGLQPDSKTKLELDSDEDEEEEQYSDGDDDYEPPAYIVKKLPKPSKPMESEEEQDRSEKDENQKEQVVFVRHKDGNMIKKTIKTLMPIQRREVQDTKVKQSPSSNQSQMNAKPSQSKQNDEPPKSSRVDETEAQVQKIVASVFKEHKIPLKHQSGQEQNKDSPTSANQARSQQGQSNSQNQVSGKEEKVETSPSISGTPKAINTIKVIKRIVVRKPSGSTETTTSAIKDGDGAGTSQTHSGHKVTKRVIVRRIIRQGDTTREVIMNPDGTIIDPAELAKLPTGNVVKRVVVKKPLDKHQSLVQAVMQSPTDVKQSSSTVKSNDSSLNESSKFELKTSQSTSTPSSVTKTTVTTVQKPILTRGDQETKEKLEQLEKRVEQQRLKIEELEARKQQEYEPLEELSPERHDESDDEQQLPLKRVFVKKKQSMYDEEKEYTDTDVTVHSTNPPATTTALTTTTTTVKKQDVRSEPEPERNKAESEVKQTENVQKETTPATPKPITTVSTTATPTTVTAGRREGKQPLITSSKVYGNKKIIVVKTEESSEVDEMNRELCDILDSADDVAKMQETVLNNLTQISPLAETSQKSFDDKAKAGPSNADSDTLKEEVTETESEDQEISIKLENVVSLEVVDSQESDVKMEETVSEEQVIEQPEQNSNLTLDEQDLSESTDIFEPSDNVLEAQKNELSDSVIELDHDSHTINLNDTNESQDSLEDKLQQMEG